MDPIDDFVDAMRLSSARANEQSARDLAAGHARIGGVWNQPDYQRAYVRAAQILVRESRTAGNFDELAVVCVYLQRHALELAIKDLIGMFYGIADENDLLATITKKNIDSLAPSNGARDRLITSHDLDALLRDLRCAHQREIDDGEHYLNLPADLAPLVEKFSELERGSPERFRYPIVRTPSRGGAKNVATQQQKRETSFAAPSVIPVEELQSRLEALTEALFWKADDDLSNPIESLGYELAEMSHHLTSELYALGAYEVSRTEEPPGGK